MLTHRYTQRDADGFKRFGDVSNGVPFDWGLANADGAWFNLVPTKGVHTPEDVDKAKRMLKGNRDVVGTIKVFWIETTNQETPCKQS